MQRKIIKFVLMVVADAIAIYLIYRWFDVVWWKSLVIIMLLLFAQNLDRSN